jgi:hypothetical protein
MLSPPDKEEVPGSSPGRPTRESPLKPPFSRGSSVSGTSVLGGKAPICRPVSAGVAVSSCQSGCHPSSNHSSSSSRLYLQRGACPVIARVGALPEAGLARRDQRGLRHGEEPVEEDREEDDRALERQDGHFGTFRSRVASSIVSHRERSDAAISIIPRRIGMVLLTVTRPVPRGSSDVRGSLELRGVG